MDDERWRIPSWQRPWRIPFLIRGIPGYKPFWRALDGRVAVGAAAILILTLYSRRWGLAPTSLPGLFWYHVGAPCAAGWAISKLRFNGKRPDRWLLSYWRYWTEARRHDRFRPARGTATYRFGGKGELP